MRSRDGVPTSFLLISIYLAANWAKVLIVQNYPASFYLYVIAGSYGKVKEAYDLETGKLVAIKILRIDQIRKFMNGLANIQSELEVYRKLTQKRLKFSCQILDVLTSRAKRKIYVIMELAEFSLTDIISWMAPADRLEEQESPDEDNLQHQGLPDDVCRYIIRHVLRALQELHTGCSILHNDIKESNIMIKNEDIKLIDFGVAQVQMVFFLCLEL